MTRAFDFVATAAFVGLKVWLLWALPITGDEAYWIGWSQSLAWGYYDHPPMVGWLLWLMSQYSTEIWWYRSFSLFTSLVLALGIYWFACVAEPSLVFRRRHRWVALAFFVSPASMLLLMTANDTVLVLFGFLGFIAFGTAVIRRSMGWALVSGLLWGAAVLSKYFAVFPLLGLLAFVLVRAAPVPWTIPIVASIGVIAAVGVNLYYNYTHCWNNIVFNFFSRTQDADWGVVNPSLYLLTLLLFVTPWGIWSWVRCGGRYTGVLQTEMGRLVRFASWPLIVVLALVSLRHSVGLHWPLLIIPILWLLYRALPEAALQGLFRWNLVASLGIGLVIGLAMNQPERWLNEAQQKEASVYTETKALCDQLPPETVFTTAYSSQSVLAYVCERDDIHVIANLSKFGREDDLRTDFRGLDGQTLHMLISRPGDVERLARFFESTETRELVLPSGQTHRLLIGRAFDYPRYREEMILPMVHRFYEAPFWFPLPASCPVRERYGL